MSFLVNCFIRNNTLEIREHLKKSGIKICPCCTFNDAVWLNISSSKGIAHGVGYWDETVPFNNRKDACEFFLKETKDYDCSDNIELFYALAFLRDDTDSDQYQWFIWPDGRWELCDCESRIDMWGDFEPNEVPPRKATKEEIINYFNS
jgi:hypothetical protein